MSTPTLPSLSLSPAAGIRPPLSTREALLDLASQYLAARLSLLPIATDGSKSPAWHLLPLDNRSKHSWRVFQSRQPTLDELRSWFAGWGPPCGLGVIGGPISSNLEIIDIDHLDLAEPWMAVVERQCPGLIDRLVSVLTPRPGLHVYFRSPACGPNDKLARQLQIDPATRRPMVKTLIECKATGGYCVAPGSPGYCHPKGRQYTYLIDRDLTQIPTITVEERDVLITAARSFNQIQPRRARLISPHEHRRSSDRARPGDDFNARADWGELLTRHGWTFVSQDDEGKQHWCRPGKSIGTSATVNFAGNDRLHVFSSNVSPLEPDTSYTKFQFLTELEYGGNHRAAAWGLRAAGYGQRQSARGHRSPGRRRPSRRRRR